MNNQSPSRDPTVPLGAAAVPEELSKANTHVHKLNSRLHVTSAALAGTGILMIMSSFYEAIHARHSVETMLNFVDTAFNVTKDAAGPAYVSKDEFAMVDDMRIICFFASIIGASLMGLARIGCMATWRKSVKYTNVSYKRSLVRFASLVVLSLIVRHYSRDMSGI